MKKLITLFTIIGLLICAVPSFGAATVYRYGDWTLTATQNESGAVFSVRSYDGSDAVVTVPRDYGGYPISELGAYSFAGNQTVQEVILDDNITGIRDGAFMSCVSLKKIEIPDSVTQIGESAFNGCEDLVIYAKSDSAAIEYAIENDIDYVCTNVTTYLLGDADGDGGINIIDATKIQRVLAELDEDNDGMIALRGDVNGNGLDILDATAVQRYIAGFEINVPIGEMMTVQI